MIPPVSTGAAGERMPGVSPLPQPNQPTGLLFDTPSRRREWMGVQIPMCHYRD